MFGPKQKGRERVVPSTHLVAFDQSRFAPIVGLAAAGLAGLGYAYVPAGCDGARRALTTTREPLLLNAQPNNGQNWTLNYDGTVDASGRAVKGAVDDFFRGRAPLEHAGRSELRRCPLQISVTYREPAWNTWLVAKPWRPSVDKHAIDDARSLPVLGGGARRRNGNI